MHVESNRLLSWSQLTAGTTDSCDVSDTFCSLFSTPPRIYPSFFSVSVLSHSPLLFNLVASSSFKNHFTLGKMQTSFELLMHLCVDWLKSISQSVGRAAADHASHAREFSFIVEQLDKRHSALYSLRHPSHGWPVRHAAIGIDSFLHQSGSPTSKPRSEG